MTKIIHNSEKAPKAVGPYSQAVQYGDLLFCSGQIAIDPETNQLLDGNVEEQTHLVFKNIKGLLSDCGSDLTKVIKATVFLKDMNDYSVVNDIYSEYFLENYPARSAIEVARLPKDVLVEIEVIAHI